MTHSRRRRRRATGLATILGAGALALGALAPAWATTPLGGQARISTTGADGDATFDALDPSVAHSPATNQYLVVWSASSTASIEFEIFGRLVDAAGAPLGAQFRISDMGGPLAVGFDAIQPVAAYNSRRNEYLVVWRGDDSPGPLVDDEFEIFAQRLDATGAEVGPNDRRISDLGPNGDTAFSAQDPAVVYNPTSDQYLVAWEGNDQVAGVDGDDEIFIQRLSSTGAPVGGNDLRVSDMGPENDPAYSADNPSVAHNPTANQYMVAWEGDDDTGPLVESEDEIYVQRLAANGAEEGVNDRRVSTAGPDGDPNFEADNPSIVFQPASDEYLVAWEGEDDAGDLVVDEDEIYIQRLAASGTQVGSGDQRISQAGPDGDINFQVDLPQVAVNPRANEYLVTWEGEDDGLPLAANEFEIFAQRLGQDGTQIGGDDVRVSAMGVDGDTNSDAVAPAVAYGSVPNEYLIAWHGDTNVAPLVDDKLEVYARRFGAGPPVAGASAVCKILPPVPAPSPGDPADITLTTGQLLINQRIDQAAIRRANGVEGWLSDGIEGRDVCQGALGQGELAAGIVSDLAGPPISFVAPDPRPIVVAPAKPGDVSQITLTTRQLLINQRISQAAIRRLNALKARMDAGLTGGDIDDDTLIPPTFVSGLRVLLAPPPATPPPASITDIAPASPGDPDEVTLTTTQLLINQRISQAAVRRANELIARIEDGLVASDVRDATVTALDLGPGVGP